MTQTNVPKTKPASGIGKTKRVLWDEWWRSSYAYVNVDMATDRRLTLSHVRMYVALARVDTRGCLCDIQLKTVAAHIGVSRQTASTVFNDLARWGYIEVERAGRVGSRVAYRVDTAAANTKPLRSDDARLSASATADTGKTPDSSTADTGVVLLFRSGVPPEPTPHIYTERARSSSQFKNSPLRGGGSGSGRAESGQSTRPRGRQTARYDVDAALEKIRHDLRNHACRDRVCDHLLAPVVRAGIEVRGDVSVLADAVAAGDMNDDALRGAAQNALQGQNRNITVNSLVNAMAAGGRSGRQPTTGGPATAVGADSIQITPGSHPVEWDAWMRWGRKNRHRYGLAYDMCRWERLNAANVPTLMPPSNDGEAA